MFIFNVALLLYLYGTALTYTAIITIKEELVTVNGKFGFLMHIGDVTSSLFFQIELQSPFTYVSSSVVNRASLANATSRSYGDVVVDNVNTSYEELSDSARLNRNGHVTLKQFEFYYLNNNNISNICKYNAVSLSIMSLQQGSSIVNYLYNDHYIHTKQFHLCGDSIYFGNINRTCIDSKYKTTLTNGGVPYWSSLLYTVAINGHVVYFSKNGSIVYFKANDYAIRVPKGVYDIIERDVIKEFVDMKMCNVGFDVKEMRKFYSCAKGVREKMKGIKFGIGGYWFEMGKEELFWEEGSEIFQRFVIVANANEDDMSFTMGTQFLKQYVLSFEYNGDTSRPNLIHVYSANDFIQCSDTNSGASLKYHLIMTIYMLLLINALL